MKFYQPSGKISGWFYLYFLVCAVGIVPLFAYGYTLAAGYVIRPKLRIAAFIKVYLTIVKRQLNKTEKEEFIILKRS